MGSYKRIKDGLLRKKSSTPIKTLLSDFEPSNALSLFFPRDVRALLPNDADLQQQYTLKHIRKYVCGLLVSVGMMGSVISNAQACNSSVCSCPGNGMATFRASAPPPVSSLKESPPAYDSQFQGQYSYSDSSHLRRPQGVPLNGVGDLRDVVQPSSQIQVNIQNPSQNIALPSNPVYAPDNPFRFFGHVTSEELEKLEKKVSTLPTNGRKYGVQLHEDRTGWQKLKFRQAPEKMSYHELVTVLLYSPQKKSQKIAGSGLIKHFRVYGTKDALIEILNKGQTSFDQNGNIAATVRGMATKSFLNNTQRDEAFKIMASCYKDNSLVKRTFKGTREGATIKKLQKKQLKRLQPQ